MASLFSACRGSESEEVDASIPLNEEILKARAQDYSFKPIPLEHGKKYPKDVEEFNGPFNRLWENGISRKIEKIRKVFGENTLKAVKRAVILAERKFANNNKKMINSLSAMGLGANNLNEIRSLHKLRNELFATSKVLRKELPQQIRSLSDQWGKKQPKIFSEKDFNVMIPGKGGGKVNLGYLLGETNLIFLDNVLEIMEKVFTPSSVDGYRKLIEDLKVLNENINGGMLKRLEDADINQSVISYIKTVSENTRQLMDEISKIDDWKDLQKVMFFYWSKYAAKRAFSQEIYV